MQANRSGQLRLQDRINKIQRQYQEENDAFDQILKWQELYETPPTTPPMYTRKEKIKHHVFFDTWKPFLKNIQIDQEDANNASMKLHSSSNNLMEEFRMQFLSHR